MAGPAPKTRGWHARESAHKPKGLHVAGGGMVEVSATNMHPVLTERPERDPKNLGFYLTIEESGTGAQVVVWKGVHFHKEVKANEFDNVIVRWDVDQIANFPIVDNREYATEADAAMKALNKKQAGAKAPKFAGKRPAAKKAAAKKAAPKKATPKKAAAKKVVAKKAAPKKKSATKKKSAAKKSAPKKKPTKKAPKKAAKKSGLKKLVRKLVKKLMPAKKKKRR
jgi:hypothetical protein